MDMVYFIKKWIVISILFFCVSQLGTTFLQSLEPTSI